MEATQVLRSTRNYRPLVVGRRSVNRSTSKSQEMLNAKTFPSNDRKAVLSYDMSRPDGNELGEL